MRLHDMWRQLPKNDRHNKEGELRRYVSALEDLRDRKKDYYKLMFDELTVLDRKTSGQLALSSILAVLFFQMYLNFSEGATGGEASAGFELFQGIGPNMLKLGMLAAATGILLECMAIYSVFQSIMVMWVPEILHLEKKIPASEANFERNNDGAFADSHVEHFNYVITEERNRRTKYYAFSHTVSLLSIGLLAALVIIFYILPVAQSLLGAN